MGKYEIVILNFDKPLKGKTLNCLIIIKDNESWISSYEDLGTVFEKILVNDTYVQAKIVEKIKAEKNYFMKKIYGKITREIYDFVVEGNKYDSEVTHYTIEVLEVLKNPENVS